MQLIFTLEERASLILWESVKLRLNRESRYARQVVAGFDYLRAFPIPNNKVELDFFLMQRNWPAAFIRKFRKWLLGVYYSSELGWQELGFVMPPQPAGYRIQLTPVKLI
ncbi:MAG: hypothetical protein MK185_15780 [Saccharospirillaceae bacterium]|nr:hypothetical protein [Saccharospirillaceae bacterium]